MVASFTLETMLYGVGTPPFIVRCAPRSARAHPHKDAALIDELTGNPHHGRFFAAAAD